MEPREIDPLVSESASASEATDETPVVEKNRVFAPVEDSDEITGAELDELQNYVSPPPRIVDTIRVHYIDIGPLPPLPFHWDDEESED